MLHSGCEYYGLQSACYDVPWYDDFFPAEKHSETEQRVILNWWFLLIEVIYHQRMNILSSIGLMTLFQFAFTLHVVLNSVQVHGSKKTLKFLLSWLWAWDLRQGDCDQMPHAGSEYPVRRGCSCALSIVHCRISWFYNDFCFSTLSTFNIHGLPCGGLPSWYVCVSTVSTSLLKSRYDMIGMLQLMSGKKIKVARLDTPQLVQIFRSGADQLWDSSVSTDLFAHS